MRSLLKLMVALAALVSATIGLSAAESETFTGTAARTGTYKRPLLVVDGKRYELKASDKADASVVEMLTRFSLGRPRLITNILRAGQQKNGVG